MDKPFFAATSDLNLILVLNDAIAYAIIIAALLCLAFIFWGGISFILSGGKEDKIKEAVNTIRYAIFGLIIVFVSFSVVGVIGRIFNLNLVGYIKPDRVYQSIQKIIDKLSDSGDTGLGL